MEGSRYSLLVPLTPTVLSCTPQRPPDTGPLAQRPQYIWLHLYAPTTEDQQKCRLGTTRHAALSACIGGDTWRHRECQPGAEVPVSTCCFPAQQVATPHKRFKLCFIISR